MYTCSTILSIHITYLPYPAWVIITTRYMVHKSRNRMSAPCQLKLVDGDHLHPRELLSRLDTKTPLGAARSTKTKGSYILVQNPNTKSIPETMVCESLMLMWPFGPRTMGVISICEQGTTGCRTAYATAWLELRRPTLSEDVCIQGWRRNGVFFGHRQNVTEPAQR